MLLSTAVERLLEDGHDVFVEISPHPVLLGSVEQCLRHHGREGITLPSCGERRAVSPLARSGRSTRWGTPWTGTNLPLQKPVRPAAILPLAGRAILAA